MRTLSPGSDFFKEPQGGATLSECTLQAGWQLSFFRSLQSTVKMIFFFWRGFFWLFPDGRSISVAAYTWKSASFVPTIHLSSKQTSPGRPKWRDGGERREAVGLWLLPLLLTLTDLPHLLASVTSNLFVLVF